MKQTPAHDVHNHLLLDLIPKDAKRVIEVGCSTGALAREYKKLNPSCTYIGIEIDAKYAKAATAHCDVVHVLDIERDVEPREYGELGLKGDCWVFGDVLEHLVDPWRVIEGIRKQLPVGGCVVACIPNAQHWSMQLKYATGELFYTPDGGLMDQTHLRWFTKMTLSELFRGFRFEEALAAMSAGDPPKGVIEAIRALSASIGGNPEEAEAGALPIQYLVRAVPL